jgi:hypothetical protein
MSALRALFNRLISKGQQPGNTAVTPAKGRFMRLMGRILLRPMSALGLADIRAAKSHVRFTPKADMCGAKGNVRFGPIADIPCPADFCDAAALADSGK